MSVGLFQAVLIICGVVINAYKFAEMQPREEPLEGCVG